MKKIFQNILIAALVVYLAAAFPVFGQTGGPYNLNWNTIDDGGGVSRGGPYTLTGTIGQPDAAYSADGRYELFSGFWAIGCFPWWHTDYTTWIDVGKPGCWCYPRQCHGDADGLAYGKKNYWVSIPDLTILKSAWNKPIEDLVGDGICADFDHRPYGESGYRVTAPDLAILKSNWNIPNGPDPNCFETLE